MFSGFRTRAKIEGGEQPPQESGQERKLTALELMAAMSGKTIADVLTGMNFKAFDPAVFLKKFEVETTKTHAIAVPHLANMDLTNIEIRADSVTADLSKLASDPKALSFEAFSMAILAKANTHLREGVEITGSEQERMVLYCAAHLAGLTIVGDPQLEPQKVKEMYDQMKPYWAEFEKVAVMPEEEAKPEPLILQPEQRAEDKPEPLILQPEQRAEDKPEPLVLQPEQRAEDKPEPLVLKPEQRAEDKSEPLVLQPEQRAKDHFEQASLHELSSETIEKLEIRGIDTDLYTQLRENVVQTGDARRDTLAEKYNLSSGKVSKIVKTLDEEGVTSKPEHPGRARTVNFAPS